MFKRIITHAWKWLLVAVVALLVADIAVVLFFGVKRPQSVRRADAIIVLGAAINSPALYNRTLEGLSLYEEGKAPVLVLSGGKVKESDETEAHYMARAILANSETPPNMLLEEQSHNTFENIINSKKLIPHADSVVIVSDSFHLARAVLLAKRAGFDEVSWSSPDSSYYNSTELRWYYTREIVAMLSYIPRFLFLK